MEISEGTKEWIAECERLVEDVLVLVARGNSSEGRQALELIFALLRRLDEGEDDIVFFADEGGSWQVGVDWPKVLPAYFRCLSETATPEEYAELVNAVVKDFARHDTPKYMSMARGAATKEQKTVLARVSGARTQKVPPRKREKEPRRS